jgi:hypothetical protein
MVMFTKLLVAGFLVAHGLIHLGFVSSRPPATAGGPPWPFDLASSWILRPLGAGSEVTRRIGMALVAATIAGFALAGVALAASLPVSIWTAGVAVGALGSIALLVLFFHPWLVIGLAIDAVLLWAVLGRGWIVV